MMLLNKTKQMFRRFTTDSNGFISENPASTSTYKIFQQNVKLGKAINEDQRREIAEKLFKKPLPKDTKKVADVEQQPTTNRVQTCSNDSSKLYKMSLEYILN